MLFTDFGQRIADDEVFFEILEQLRTTPLQRRLPIVLLAFDLELAPVARKSTAATKSFGQAVVTIDALKKTVASFATRAAEKLREQELVAGVDRIWREGFRFSKAGVILEDLVAASAAQPSLFGSKASSARRAKLMTAMDAINTKHGRGSLAPAAIGLNREWAGTAANRSPAYTTRLAEIRVLR